MPVIQELSFNERINAGKKEFEDKGLKHTDARVYNLSESNIHPLAFTEQVARVWLDAPYELRDIQLDTDLSVDTYQIDERRFGQIVFPVFKVSGVLDNDITRIVKGIIVPHIVLVGKEKTIDHRVDPEFHFYMNSPSGELVGKSVNYWEGKMVCGYIKPEKPVDAENIGFNFRVQLPHVTPIMYFERP